MPQTGYTPIQLYRSATASATPSASDLQDGELAINTNDGKLFFKNSSGNVATLVDSTSAGTVTSVGGTGTVNGITLSGTVTSSGNLTLGGTLANVNLTSQVTGTLPVANGGTNLTVVQLGLNTRPHLREYQQENQSLWRCFLDSRRKTWQTQIS